MRSLPRAKWNLTNRYSQDDNHIKFYHVCSVYSSSFQSTNRLHRTTTTSSPIVSSSTTSASSSATSLVCTGTPVPSAPVCSGSSGLLGNFMDACGYNYTIYCTSDTAPGSVTQYALPSISSCMQACDNYPGCRAATFVSGTCYIKTSFANLVSTTNTAIAALVRYIPPNPAYPAPVAAPGTNTSTGCGSMLPAGVTPGGTSVYFNIINPSDGLQRNWTIHIPQFYNPNAASPLIMAFPGNGESASNIENETGMSDSVTNPYAIMAYVNGVGLGFQSNPAYAPGGTYGYVDDLGFINLLIANLTASYCIDTGKIFAIGHSNGGGFVNVLACDPVLSVKIAAFAASSGAFYTSAGSGNPATIEPVNTPVQALCSPGRNNTPILEVHGTADATINYLGGPRNGKILPTIPHWTTDWALRQGYSANNYTTNPAPNVTMYQFGGDSSAGQLGIVTHYMLTGWIHLWAATSSGAPISMTPLLLPFFYKWTNTTRAPAYAPNYVSTTSSSTASSTTSTVSSLTSSTSATVTPTETAVAFACPGVNGQTVSENSQPYVIGCGSLVSGRAFGSAQPVSNSWNDCFLICDATANCTGFVYAGLTNGIGAGNCFLRNGTTQGFLTNDTSHVGAIRAANYVAIVTTFVPLFCLAFNMTSC